MAVLRPDILKFIVNHVVLPPQLPQEAEDSQITRAAERGLISLLSTQLEEFRRQSGHRTSNVFAVWASIEVMLGHCALLISSHALAADVLVRAFQSLHTAGESCDLARGMFELTSTLSQPFNHPHLSKSSKCSADPARKRQIRYLRVFRSLASNCCSHDHQRSPDPPFSNPSGINTSGSLSQPEFPTRIGRQVVQARHRGNRGDDATKPQSRR